MKTIKITALILCASILFISCGTSKTVQGGAIGGGSGAALGAIIGAIAGKGKGAAIGGAIGAALGTTAGALVGHKMDKAAKEAAKIEGAKVEKVDLEGVPAVKVTLSSAVTFAVGKSNLNLNARTSLATFARNLDSQVNVAIFGHTDNTGSLTVNQNLSFARANSVANYLRNHGVEAYRIKEVRGLDFQEPIADNSTPQGRAMNRRVEVYLLASEAMINEAKAAKKY